MSNTKKVVLIVTGVVVVCLIGLGIVMAAYAAGGNTMSDFLDIFSGARVTVDETHALELDGVSGILVECASGNVTVMPGNEPKVDVTGSLWTRKEKDQYVSVLEKNGQITVKFELEDMLFNWSDINIVVYLPEDCGLNLKVSCASANTTVRQLALGNVSVTCASGNTEISACTGKTLDIAAASGGVSVEDCAFGSIRTACQSGNIAIRSTEGAAAVQCTSGRVTLVDVAGSLDINNISGDVTVELSQKEIDPIDIRITSGKITLRLNAEAAFDLDAETTSGSIRCNFDRTVSGGSSGGLVGDRIFGEVGGGGVTVTLRAVSGNIDIIKD
jgi:lia operon protein LiaG